MKSNVFKHFIEMSEPSSVPIYRSTIRAFSAWLKANYGLDVEDLATPEDWRPVKAAHVHAFEAYLHEGPAASSTVSNMMAIVRKFFHLATLSGDIPVREYLAVKKIRKPSAATKARHAALGAQER